ncbi:MAG: LarC family nickel insertion protein, partial [Luteolibacter sp.]
MKTAYLDCIAGASGDMLLGALIDSGLPISTLEAELAKLGISDFQLQVSKVSKNGFGATKVDVLARDEAPERRLRDIREIVENSAVSKPVKLRAMRVFTRICEVEAAIHGMSVDEVHLHEVGAVDAIVDVVGVLAGFELLGIQKVVVSPVPLGRGFVSGAHGQIPLPAPAAL